MQSKDFRIGNLVNLYGGGDDNFTKPTRKRYLGVIKSVSDGFISWNELEKKPKFYHESFEPIHLKEEWLLKLGFVRTFHGWFKNSIVLELDKNLNIRFEYHNGEIFTFKIITFVHELQNLYFVLTGKELELKHEPKP
jgi:hypothetical protein